MVGRKFSAGGGYRYGFNGKEMDKDMNSLTAYDYGFRIYNPAIGRFLSVDPLTHSYPWYTPYQFAGNMPINSIDLDGLESKVVIHWVDKVQGDGALKIVKTRTSIDKTDKWIEINPFDKTPTGRVYAITETYYYFFNENKLFKGKDLLEEITQDGPKPSANYDYTQNELPEKMVDDKKYAGSPWNPLNWLKYARLVKRDSEAPDNAMVMEDVNMGMLAFTTIIGASGAAKGILKAEGVAVEGPNAAASVGAARRLEYEAAPYHGKVDNAVKSRAPINGQDALDMSIQVKESSPRRIGIDYSAKEFVVFDKTIGVKYHGHVRVWADLHKDMQNALKKAGMVDNKGNILTGGN